MAPAASHRRIPGRTGRVLHWVFPSRRRTLIALAVEVAAVLLKLPLLAHVMAAVVTHLSVALVPGKER